MVNPDSPAAKPLSLTELAIIVAIAAVLSWAVCFAAVETTTITGKVILTGGIPATGGTVVAQLSMPGSSDDVSTGEAEAIVGRYSGTIAADGTITGLKLVPNDRITPTGTYYVFTVNVTTPGQYRSSSTRKGKVSTLPDPVDIGDVTWIGDPPGIEWRLDNLEDVFVPSPTDGQVLVFSGGNARWEAGQQVSHPPGWHRANQAGSMTGRYYVAGMVTAGNAGTATLPPNQLRAAPLLQGKARTVDSVVFSVIAGGNVGAQGRACIYSSVSDANPYPGALVAGGSCQAGISMTGVKTCSVSVSLAGDALYWVAFNHGDTVGTPSFSSVPQTQAGAFFGVSSGFGADGVGVSVASTFGASCPDPFPAGGMAVADTAAVGVRYAD